MALLVLALTTQGLRAEGFNPLRLPIVTRGAFNDAEPVVVDTAKLRNALEYNDVVVFPGFVGVDLTGVPSLLGRSGSDLTALFLGHARGDAGVCLVKDVDGVYPADPRTNPGIKAYEELEWSEAIRVGGQIVQGKAVAFAERHRMRFRVAGLGGRGTWVGAWLDFTPAVSTSAAAIAATEASSRASFSPPARVRLPRAWSYRTSRRPAWAA